MRSTASPSDTPLFPGDKTALPSGSRIPKSSCSSSGLGFRGRFQAVSGKLSTIDPGERRIGGPRIRRSTAIEGVGGGYIGLDASIRDRRHNHFPLLSHAALQSTWPPQRLAPESPTTKNPYKTAIFAEVLVDPSLLRGKCYSSRAVGFTGGYLRTPAPDLSCEFPVGDHRHLQIARQLHHLAGHASMKNGLHAALPRPR